MQIRAKRYARQSLFVFKRFLNTHRYRYKLAGSIILAFISLALIAALNGQQQMTSIPNGYFFPNPSGASQTYSTTGRIDLTGPFFQVLGTNGRTCATCHLPGEGMSISAE